MKKLLFLAAVVLAVCSCGKEKPAPTPVVPSDIVFDLGAVYPEETPETAAATKSVKEGWEENDVIFVFFQQGTGLTPVEPPAYLEMKCHINNNKASWVCTVQNGPLGLKNNDTGTMRAVYLPFGNAATVYEGDHVGEYEFDKYYSSYYLTATLPYTVSNNKVSGNFAMSVPEGYVQFYVADTAASDGAYSLSVDAVKPVEIVSVLSDGSLNVNEKLPGDNMPGYKYKDGYLFSGVFVKSYTDTYGGNYYFAKTKISDGTRTDYFIGGKKVLASHDSVKLPANNSSKWQAVGSGKTVKLSKTGSTTSYGTWYTCNEGATKPESAGTLMGYDAAVAAQVTATTPNKKLPPYSLLDKVRSVFTWTAVSVKRIPGMVLNSDGGFLFFPLGTTTPEGWYWSAREYDSGNAYHLYLKTDGQRALSYSSKTMQHSVRYISAE